MSLKLMYITNNTEVAKLAEKSGVDKIFIDLEINGKEERQGHLDTVISRHHIDDVKKIKDVLNESKLLVRVNPIYEGSKIEIDKVVKDGADIVMLPFFKTKNEVEKFVKYVDNRAKVCLLCETPEAVANIDKILEVEGVYSIHIGLNDLHLGYGMKFMFEPLVNGVVEDLCNKFSEKGIQYGFGGIARLGEGTLPAERIVTEHYRLKSKMVILSRSFYKQNDDLNHDEMYQIFDTEIKKIRNYEKTLVLEKNHFFQDNKLKVKEIVKRIVK